MVNDGPQRQGRRDDLMVALGLFFTGMAVVAWVVRTVITRMKRRIKEDGSSGLPRRAS